MKLLIQLIAILFLSTSSFAQSGIATRKTKQEKGYFNVTELGVFFGTSYISSSNSKDNSPANVRSLRTINGVFINSNLSLGIGVGLDGIDTKYYGFYNTFNISADARYYLKTSHDGIFLYTNLGPSLKIDDNFEQGFMLNAGVGHKLTIGSSFVIVPSIGYYHQNFKRDVINYSNETIAFKLGFLF